MQLWAPSKDVLWEIVEQSHLFLSVDGGTTWSERVLTPVTLVFAGATWSFTSAVDGWMLVQFQPGTQCQQQDTQLWHTTDGARSWSLVTPFTLTTFQCKRGLTFVDASRGFILTADTTNPPTIHRTVDGGKTWTGAVLPSPPGLDTSTPGYALQPRQLKLYGSTAYVTASGIGGGPNASYLFGSIDSGASWSYIGPWETGRYMVTATRWLRFTSPSLESTDAGATWHSFATNYEQVFPDNGPTLVFADANVGYMTVGTSGSQAVFTLRTTDGGVHWTGMLLPVGTVTP